MEEEKYKRIINAIKLMYSFLPNKPEYIRDVLVTDIFAWLDKQVKNTIAVNVPTVAYITDDNRLSVSVDLNTLKGYENLKNSIKNNSDLALVQQAVDKARDLTNTIEGALAGEEPFPATYYRMC